jgi:hypothetical protein
MPSSQALSVWNLEMNFLHLSKRMERTLLIVASRSKLRSSATEGDNSLHTQTDKHQHILLKQVSDNTGNVRCFAAVGEDRTSP